MLDVALFSRLHRLSLPQRRVHTLLVQSRSSIAALLLVHARDAEDCLHRLLLPQSALLRLNLPRRTLQLDCGKGVRNRLEPEALELVLIHALLHAV